MILNRKCIKIFVFVISIFLFLEIVLRSVGFCDALLYKSSDKYEYIPQPNQNRSRFGACIHYNSYSQRSDEPDTTKTIVLGLGDSVLFGGTWMDQNSLATSILSDNSEIQMLNISAGSWGPDNCAAYLKEKGTFNAKAIILVCSSHDAYDVMSHVPVVGIYPNYPNKQYSLAIVELIERYLLPKINIFFYKKRIKLDPDESVVNSSNKNYVSKKSLSFNDGFNQLKQISDSLNIPFGIYLHAEFNEIVNNKYNSMGEEICEWAVNNNVEIMKGLYSGETTDMYVDIIHLNEKGQKHLGECLRRIVDNLIYKKKTVE